MVINTVELMSETSMYCRCARRNAGPAVEALRTMLHRIKQTRALELDDGDEDVAMALGEFALDLNVQLPGARRLWAGGGPALPEPGAPPGSRAW
jgi:hypothetical protein